MTDLLNPLFLLLYLLLAAEFAATVVFSRRKVRHRRVYVLASYLVLLGIAVLFAVIRPDEFGFGWIPLIVLTRPGSALGANFLVWGALGAALNCTLFLLLDWLVYPLHSIDPSGQRAT